MRLRVMLVLVLACGVVTGIASGLARAVRAATAHRGSTPCAERPGKVWLENRDVRVYSRRWRAYACGRPSGAPVFLFRTRNSINERLQLSGHFVAWEQWMDSGGSVETERIALLDLRTRRMRHMGSIQVGGHEFQGSGIADFLVGTSGTVIWLDDQGSVVGPFFSLSSTLRENAGRTDVILDQKTNSDSAGGSPVFPIGSLGLSHDERVIYWTDDGRVMSAPRS